MRMRVFQRVLTAGFTCGLLAVWTLTPAYSEGDHGVLRTVSVSATGSVQAEPDTASINTGVESQAETAREALSLNSGQTSRVIDALKAAGIEAKDIQTSALQLNPRYQAVNSGSPMKIIGYTASNQLRVTLHDIGRIGDLLDKVVTLGANRVNGISFGVAKIETLKDEARKLAMTNALRRAELYATAAGVKLGPVVTISESIETSGPQLRGLPVAAAAKFAGPVPIEAGEQRLDATIHVTWEVQ